MAAQQAWVVKVMGGWTVKVNGAVVERVYSTQEAAHDAARRWLLANGGGELIVQGEDGKIRIKDTIGRPDPRGHG